MRMENKHLWIRIGILMFIVLCDLVPNVSYTIHLINRDIAWHPNGHGQQESDTFLINIFSTRHEHFTPLVAF